MNDSGFESRLSRLMRDAADGAPTPRGLPKEIRTRVRGRQIAIAFAAVVLFSGVIGGTTVAVLTTTDGSQPIDPARPPAVPPRDVDAVTPDGSPSWSAPLTRIWTVASGRHRGYQWRYEAQLRSFDGNLIPCPGISVEPLGGFGDCGITITRGGNVAYSHVSFDKAPRLSAVFGSVSDRVESLVIELSSGERVEAEMFAIPRRFEDELGSSDFRLFLVFPMPQSSGRPQGAVLAIDEEGEVTERIPLCSPQADPSVSTCGN